MANIGKYLAELADAGWQMPTKKSYNPLVGDYSPETDKIPDMEQDIASWYESLIDKLRWMFEIGRVDIITLVSIMTSYMAMPRERHLEVVLNVFAFLHQR